jgi:3'-phosphoadenosine 5'-phosphosulfate sulfotransferase (PAPS reductase)/FAD synthetase
MFSGGNDSTTLAHLFKDKVTHYGHANTGFGIEETREYVRETSRQWGIPLLERFPEAGYGYRELVLGLCKSRTWYAKYPLVFPGGFPGPAQHAMMFQRLKERGMGQIRNEFNVNPRNQRVIFLGGRRASESSRRSFRYDAGELSYIETRGSIVWVSPILEWDKLDLNEYRRRNPEIPRNETSDLLHMSGECECGCYAHEGEYEEIRMWRPKMADEIDDLENELAAKDLDVNPKTLKWGWNQRGKCNTGLCNS